MKLRPLFVTGSLVHGGAERHTITLINRLAERGHDCHAVYVKDDRSQLARIRQRDGGRVRCLDARHFLDRQALRVFAAHLGRLRPQVIVAANGYALMYATLARLMARLRVPIIVTYHTTDLIDWREGTKALLERPCFWQAHSTVFVCERQKRHWLVRGLGSRHNPVIHNGVDCTHFQPAPPEARQATRQAAGFADDELVIALPAVLRPEKNPLQLVDALAALRAIGVPARVLMIGDGPLRNDVLARARAHGVADRLTLTGFQSDVRPWLAASDVVTLCSVSETFSLAALEAMAMGKPLVLSDVGGAAEMVFPGQNGFLFPAGDTDTLARHLLTLTHRPLAERLGQAARHLVEASFSEDRMVDQYDTLLQDACLHAARGPAGLPLAALPGHTLDKGARRHENV